VKLHKPEASIFAPDGRPVAEALARTTHLGIGAHADDLEVMAYHGIAECLGSSERWFAGITCTTGAGSPRTGRYARCSDDEMRRLRRGEQQRAAELGEYGAIVQLDYDSAAVKDPGARELREDLTAILEATSPRVVYTHNPADRHDTHVAVVVAVIDAIRRLPALLRPGTVYGCEAWRGLDWMSEQDVVALDVGKHPDLARRLVEVFASQIDGGKRYDLATIGRRQANATFAGSHSVDQHEHVWLAMDLSPLAADDGIDLLDFVAAHLDRFADDVEARLKRCQTASEA